jgi:hypothetical protein
MSHEELGTQKTFGSKIKNLGAKTYVGDFFLGNVFRGSIKETVGQK